LRSNGRRLIESWATENQDRLSEPGGTKWKDVSGGPSPRSIGGKRLSLWRRADDQSVPWRMNLGRATRFRAARLRSQVVGTRQRRRGALRRKQHFHRQTRLRRPSSRQYATVGQPDGPNRLAGSNVLPSVPQSSLVSSTVASARRNPPKAPRLWLQRLFHQSQTARSLP
jgi:hypothetical protein